MRHRRLASAGLLAIVAVAGCSESKPPLPGGNLDTRGVLVAKAPVATASPEIFEAGLPSTQTLPTGQRVELTVGGPSLTNPIAGKPVQFADLVTETFHVTAVNHGTSDVTFTPAEFVVRTHPFHPEIVEAVTGPASVLVKPGASRTWDVAATEPPGEGQVVWRVAGKTLGSWQFVVEND